MLFEEELLRWNANINLTAISDSDGVRSKHFLDSMSTYPLLKERTVRSVIDVGTGAGFPGLVIKLLLPEIKLTLVESVGKKLQFCEHICTQLGFTNVTFVNARAEEVGQEARHREQYDVAIARAVAQLPILVEYLVPLVGLNGIVVAQKGESGPAEAQKAEYAIRVLGGHLRQLIQVNVPEVVEDRYLVVIDKIATTHDRYPRRVGMPAKRPLLPE
jgi:16S rRNA (guanine527-N7)-methyltransferase